MGASIHLTQYGTKGYEFLKRMQTNSCSQTTWQNSEIRFMLIGKRFSLVWSQLDNLYPLYGNEEPKKRLTE